MLDAYIIDRIRRERERASQRDAQIPLHIEERPPMLPQVGEDQNPDRRRPPEDPPEERGSAVIDFRL